MVKHNAASRQRPSALSEREWIGKIKRLALVPRTSGLTLGIGDDCAIFAPRRGQELLFTTDMLIEDVHFRRDTHRAQDVGWTALARGLSDIAAMGGVPKFCLLSLALPPWADSRWVNGFYSGLLRLSADAGAPLAGGDLAHSQKLMCDIVVCGSAPYGRALRRDGARVGDEIFVSGALGGSALGMQTRAGAAGRRHRRPRPRLALGRFLRERVHATAAMDLSDGLSLDLSRLCEASGVAAEITRPPIFRGASLEQALHGGEDYELLFTAPTRASLPLKFEGLRLTRIGVIRRGKPGTVLLDGRPLTPQGYDHFRTP